MIGSIQDMRVAFSKAAIVISQSGIFAVYNNTENGYLSQPENDNSDIFHRAFHQMLISSNGFRIKFHKGFSMTLEFDTKDLVDIPVFYPPLREQMSLEALREISEETIKDIASNGEFIEFLSGVDFSDDDDVRIKLNEWVNAHSTESENIISFSRKTRFNKMLAVLQKIQSYGFECSEICEPKNKQTVGFLTLSFDCGNNTPCGFSGKSLEYLADLTGFSDAVGLEADINEGCVDITFYV